MSIFKNSHTKIISILIGAIFFANSTIAYAIEGSQYKNNLRVPSSFSQSSANSKRIEEGLGLVQQKRPAKKTGFSLYVTALLISLFSMPDVSFPAQEAIQAFSRKAPISSHLHVNDWERLRAMLEQELPRDEIERNIEKFSRGIDLATAPGTQLLFSHRLDPRIGTWGFTYDNMIGVDVRLLLGQTETARRVLEFYRTKPGIQKLGGIVTGIHANKPEGSMAEAHVMNGPLAFQLIAELHTYDAAQDNRNFNAAIKQAEYLLSMQNTTKGAFNFGGFRMGPKGDPNNPYDQRLNFDPNAAQWYEPL